MYRKVRFRSTIPAPWGDGDVLPESSKGTERVAQALAPRVSHVSAVEQHNFYGWGFWSKFEGCTFDNVINPVDDDCFMTISMPAYLVRQLTFRRPRRTFDSYCQALDEALRTITEVSAIEWRDYGEGWHGRGP